MQLVNQRPALRGILLIVRIAQDMQPGINRIDMSNCPTGVYLVRTKDETVKVVKK